MTALPAKTDFTGPTVTEGQFKTALEGMHDYLTAAIGSDALFAIKAADESLSSSTVLQDDDDLQLTLEANSTYQGKMFLNVTSASTNGNFVHNLIEADGDWSAVMIISEIGLASASVSAVDSATTPPVIGVSAGVARKIRWDIEINTGGSGGVFKLQWAQSFSEATATIVKAGSYLKATKLA